MEKDVQKTRLRRVGQLAVAAGICVLAVQLAGCGSGPVGVPDAGKHAAAPPIRLFLNWPKDRQPDVVLVLTGQQHGYALPCGCSEPQYGGLDRRYNFLQSLVKERGWRLVAVDVGDIAQESGPQRELKYKYLMEALKRLNYSAVGVGEHEMRMPLLVAGGQFALNNASPRLLAANLLNRQANFPRDDKNSMIGAWILAGGQNNVPRVGVAGVVGRVVAAKINDPDVKFAKNGEVLPGVIKEMEAAQSELNVLLYQGTADEAKACAKEFPQFHVIQCLTAESEPPANPEKVGQTLVVGLGHKGKYIGLVGAFRTSNPQKPFDLYYQLVLMDPIYETAPGKEADSPMLALLEEYTKEVQQGNYLNTYVGLKTPHPIQMEPEFKDARYVGSEKCQKCHDHAYKVWKRSAHAHAYQSLVKATRPSLRQFDGECVSCHVTGFEHKTGFEDASRPELLNNGCENCHGPCSIHVHGGLRGTDPKLLKLMNPYKTQPNETPEQREKRVSLLDRTCQKCHDIDNDVHWKFDKWALIEHRTPADKPAEK